MKEHLWTQPRRAFPGSEIFPSEDIIWRATEAGLWMGEELIGFPEASREILRLAEGIERLAAEIAATPILSPGAALLASQRDAERLRRILDEVAIPTIVYAQRQLGEQYFGEQLRAIEKRRHPTPPAQEAEEPADISAPVPRS